MVSEVPVELAEQLIVSGRPETFQVIGVVPLAVSFAVNFLSVVALAILLVEIVGFSKIINGTLIEEFPAVFLALIVILNFPDFKGVPLNNPVELFKLKPLGKPEADQVTGVVPSERVN